MKLTLAETQTAGKLDGEHPGETESIADIQEIINALRESLHRPDRRREPRP